MKIGSQSSCAAKEHPATERRVTAQNSRLPSLDGWRALSILMVLGLHAERQKGFPKNLPAIYDWIFDGDLGVRFFFIISGFLITWLMLDEHSRTENVSLKNFYIRRAFRILPVYLAFVGVLFLLQRFTAFSQSPREWLANLTFTTNFANVPWPSQHLWSLSVEEQFYILWPCLFVGLGLATNAKAARRVLCVPLLIAPVFRALEYKRYYPQSLSIACTHGSFFRYFDSLSVGCGCAILLVTCSPTVRTRLGKSPLVVPLAAAALITLPHIFNLLVMPETFVTMARHTLQALGLALLLLQSVCFPELLWYRWLNWPAVRHLGVLSYSIYIWQQIFFAKPADFGLSDAWWLTFPAGVVMALIVAHVSYYGLERPFLAIRAKFRAKSLTIGGNTSTVVAQIKAESGIRAETPPENPAVSSN